jgi:hypothetical protein
MAGDGWKSSGSRIVILFDRSRRSAIGAFTASATDTAAVMPATRYLERYHQNQGTTEWISFFEKNYQSS